jgi:uncharacterized RDD family membrane protein YckC
MPDEPTGSPDEGPPSYPGSPGSAAPTPESPQPQPQTPQPQSPQPQTPPAVPAPLPPPIPPPEPMSYPAPPTYSGAPSYPGVAPPDPPGSYPVGGYAPPQGQMPSYNGAGESVAAPYAPWGVRLGGYLIDFIILIPVFIVLALLFRHTHVLTVHFNTKTNGVTTRRTFSLLSFFVTGVVYLAYATILCGGPRGQTVGMMAVGIRVVRDGTYEIVGYGRAFLRALVEQIFRLLAVATLLLGVVWLLDMLFPLWDKKRQTLHDKIVQTVVLRVRNVA